MSFDFIVSGERAKRNAEGTQLGEGEGMMRVGLVFAGIMGMLCAQAQGQEAQVPRTPAEATAMVTRAVERQLAQAKTHQPMRFELRKTDERHDTTKAIIETRDGDVARLIAAGGKPLPAEAAEAERARLDDLVAHPELEQKRHREEQRDAERASRLIGLLPQAFVYAMAGTVPCGSGEMCFRLSFTPKPDWNPPDLESSLLKSLAGELWIDQEQGRITRLDARFIQDADLGLGLLARVNKGGTAFFAQTDVGAAAGAGHDWQITEVRLEVTGRVVLFKALSVKSRQQMSHFALVPSGMDYRAAVRLLESETGSVGAR